jgi:predicted nucleic acid-binding protein
MFCLVIYVQPHTFIAENRFGTHGLSGVDRGFIVLPFTENIGHRASIYIEEYTLSSGLRSADAIIAATAVDNNLALMSSNRKHFRTIKELNFKKFTP